MRDLIPLFVTILSGYRKIFKIKEYLNLFACLHKETFFGGRNIHDTCLTKKLLQTTTWGKKT